MATRAEIRAVRKVLYDRMRLRMMRDEVRSIDVLMNTDPRGVIPPDDVRVTAGSGPTWFIPATGAVEPGVLEAAERCKRVARLLRETRKELKSVDFDASDKRELRNALAEHAEAWIARGEAWRATGRPVDAKRLAKGINRHDAAAIKSYARVERYLDPDRLERT